MGDQQRIDKWLWATRIFKTRSIAADACKKGRISLNGRTLKPASMISVGDVLKVRKPPITFSFEVLALLNSRVGPKQVENYLRNVTPKSEYEVLELQKISGNVGRQKGTGRPTKKERRDLDQFIHDKSSPDWFLDDWEYDDLEDEEDEKDVFGDDDWDTLWQ